MKPSRLPLIVLTMLALATLLGAPLRPAPAAAQGEPQAVSHTVYLPLIRTLGTSPAPEPPPPGQDGFDLLLLTRTTETNSASSAVGRDGAMHMAGAAYVPYGQASPAFYATCPAGGACGSIAGWSVVQFADKVDELQLELTPAGKPRMLLLTSDNHYQYASCDSGCTRAASWSVLDLLNSNDIDVDQFDSPQRSFALDPQGRPRFIYYDDTYPRGSYYVFCDSGCASGDNWYRTRISQYTDYDQDRLDYPSLAFTPDGRPRVLSQIFTHQDSADESGIYYLSCDADCGEEASWQRARLFERGQGPDASWDLEVDAAGRPRATFYQEELAGGGGDRLRYAACDASCLQPASWKSVPIGLAAGEGEDPDLALDSKGRPRIAYHSAQAFALGYAWCDASCTAAAGWKHQDVDPLADLDEEFPVTTPTLCDPAMWLGGYRMSLSIDADDNPRVAYDVLNAARCLTQDPFTGLPRSRIETLWLAVRWAAFPQP